MEDHGITMGCKKLIVLFAIFIISICCSGCATYKLKRALTEEMCPFHEISPEANITYCGHETINNKHYYRYLIASKPFQRSIIRSSVKCTCNRTIEMLLPIEVQFDSKAIIREANSRNACISLPAQIVDGPLTVSNDLQSDSMYYPIQMCLISNIAFSLPDVVRYQIMLKDQNARIVNIIVESSDLKFVCRSKAKHILHLALVPFAVVFDIIMSPIEIIYFLLWASGSGV